MHSWEPGLVSVIMPAYNKQETLAESAESVIKQTFARWELLIIDDASRDETLEIAQRLAPQDSRIRVIHLSQNRGVANARNAGLAAALGQYVAFLDSDDLWEPEKLQIQVQFMRDRDIGFSFTQYRRFGPNGFRGGSRRVPRFVEYDDLLKGNLIGCLTVMIDRAKIPDISMPEIGHEDYATWLKILRDGHTAWGIQRDLAKYRISSASVSSHKGRSAVWTWRIYREMEKLSLLRSVWCFALYSARAFFTRLSG
jgi:glycosyltransferase involved in cell wall biosynthesis